MKLHVIYKGQTVDISYDWLYLNADAITLRFSNSNAQSCKFLTQYLEANRLDYVLKDREDYKEIVALPDIFALTLSTKGTYRSLVVKDNLYDAIIERDGDITNTRHTIHNIKNSITDIESKIKEVERKAESTNSEYIKSLQATALESLEFQRAKAIESLTLAEHHLLEAKESIPTVEALEVAYEVSTLFKLEEFAKLLYIYGYLEEQSKLSKKYQKVYEVLDKLEKYMYPEYVKEVEVLGRDLFAELQEKAAKWCDEQVDISEWVREKCRQFGFEVKSVNGE